MKYCLHWTVLVIVASISFSVPQENKCNLKPFLKSSDSKVLQLRNITCIKSQPCYISERNTSCSAFQEDSYALSLKNIQFENNDEGLSIQLILSSLYLFHMYPKGTAATFVVRVHLNNEEQCYNFAIPAFLIKEHSFTLPCIHVSSEQKKTLQLLMSVYYKASVKERGELASIQAALYDLSSIPRKRTIKSKLLKFKGHFDELSFHLSFNSKCSFLYHVSIHEANGKGLCTNGDPICKDVNRRSMVGDGASISIDCDLSLFKPCQLYCLRILSSLNLLRGRCSYIYPNVSTEIAYFHRIADDKIVDFKSALCKNWNASVNLLNNSIKATITVTVSFKFGFEKYGNCFPCYEVQLLRLFTQSCDPYQGMNVENKKVSLKNMEAEARFNNLSNGNFCTLIVPCMKYSYKVTALNSSIVSILHEEPKKVPKFPQSQNFPLESLIASIILLSFVGFGFLWYIRSALGHQKKKGGKEKDVKMKEKNIPEIIPLLPQKILVHVFDSWSDTSSLLSDFKDFLQTCAEFELVDDMVKRFLINQSTWTKEIFDYHCSKMGDSSDSNTKFMFIHSGRYKPNDYYNKDKAFKRAITDLLALTGLLTNGRKGKEDECHVFVVYLDEPQCNDGTEDLVPSKRYDIRNNQLIDLCIDMGYPPSRRKTLQNHLEKHKIYEICKKKTQTS